VEPFGTDATIGLASSYYFTRQYGQAIGHLKAILQTNPDYWFAHAFLGRTLAQKGDYEGALKELQHARRVAGDVPEIVASIAWIEATRGNTIAARKGLQGLEESSKQWYLSGYNLAIIYGALGEKDHAFQLLQDAINEHSFYPVLLRVDPEVDSVRTDPRFQELLERMHLS
jgi:tetratricopeptide (TPR) repeat protein